MRKAMGIVLLAVFAASIAAASDCIRCKGRLACVGDNQYEVWQTCGDPDYRTVTAVETQGNHVAVALGNSIVFSEWESKRTAREKWVYNEGPCMFLRVLTFDKGELIRIEHRGKP